MESHEKQKIKCSDNVNYSGLPLSTSPTITSWPYLAFDNKSCPMLK